MKKIKELLKDKKAKKIIIILLSLYTVFALSLSLDIVSNEAVAKVTDSGSHMVKILVKFNQSLNMNIVTGIILFLGLRAFYLKTFFTDKNNKGYKNIYKTLFSILLAVFMVLGYSYSKLNNWDIVFGSAFQFIKSCIVAIGYYIIFRAIINYVFDTLLEKIKYKASTNKVFNFIFEKHSFIIPLIIILICWIPYLVIYFPGVITPDSANQIKQFFGIQASGSTDSVNLIDENVKITNHHPVLHTVILGLCMKFGKLVGSDNIGVFIYTVFQMVVFASSLAYIIHFMKKIHTPNWIRVISLLNFALIPVFPYYAIEITKDTIFAALTIVYMIQLYILIVNAKQKKYSIKQMILLIILLLLICLMRNNGIYLVILSFPFLAIIDKVNRKNILLITIIVVVIFKAFTSLLLPALKISPSSVREMLSIPFQQTARYVKEYPDEVTDEERESIDKILDYDTLAERYNPTRSDNVKNKYNKDATNKDLMNYFKIWFKQFLKHPTVYVQATMNNVYGYFYPECKIVEISLQTVNYNKSLENTGEFDYKYLENLNCERNIVNILMTTIQKIPVISWIINIGLNTWILLGIVVYLLYTKRYRYLIYIIPMISILLVNIASPVNNYFRYAIPYIFAMPLIISILIGIVNKEKGRKENE